MRTNMIAAMGVGVLATLALALTAPAHAGALDATWTANGESSITGQYTAQLKGGNTSVETADLGVEVEADTVVTFDFALLDGATCTAGAPRVFVVVGSVNTNSWDQLQPAGTQCGTDGRVTFTIADAGTIGAAGVVYDNGGTGSVVVSNLTIGGQRIAFRAGASPTATPTAGPTTTPTANPTANPTTGPTTDPTTGPTATPSPGGNGGGGLPVTGAAAGTIAASAAVLVAVGIVLVFFGRRRRGATFGA